MKHALGFVTLVAGFCSAFEASAVSINPHGLGQVLLYPYYTVNRNQDTLLSVTNTADVGKAVKVRFLEGYNGRSVLEFVLFLSPHDVWTGAISAVADTFEAKLVTSDHSCTLPAIPPAGQHFSSANYDGSGPPPFDHRDGGSRLLLRTREGHIEIIADGDIIPGSLTDQRTKVVQGGSQNGGTPPGCGTLAASEFPGDLVAPGSELAGSVSIVNVGDGTFFSTAAYALTEFTNVVLASSVDVDTDTLAAANTGDVRGSGRVRATLPMASGQVLSLDYSRGIDAVSAVLMADAIINEYLDSPSLGAHADWIVTFPTKRFYTDALVYESTPRAPFDAVTAANYFSLKFGFDVYNQEDLRQSLEGSNFPVDSHFAGFASPAVNLPYEVNAIGFDVAAQSDRTYTVLGSFLGTGGPDVFLDNAGWARLKLDSSTERHVLPGGRVSDGSTVAINGLPVAGFMVYNIINADAASGRLANYGGSFPHRSTVSCSPCLDAPAP